MNAWQTTENPPETVHRNDVKIQKAKDIADLYSQIGDRDCFSIGDSVFGTQAIFDFFDAEFPTSSPFEKDCQEAGKKSLVPMGIRYPSML